MANLIETVKEKSGIYSSGFNPSSVAGFLLPGLFVIIVGGAIAFWIAFAS